MTWRIRITASAEKYYNKLDGRLRKRIKDKLIELSHAENPLEHPQIRQLTGNLKEFHRLRIGDYRIIFSLLKDSHTISVVHIIHRGSLK